MKPNLPSCLRAALPLAVALGLDDDDVASAWGVNERAVAGYRSRIKLPNGRGWPLAPAALKKLLDEGWTDVEIGRAYRVGRRTVEQARINALALYRSHANAPRFRRVALTAADKFGRKNDLGDVGAFEKARAALVAAGRLRQMSGGAWMLDGRVASVQQIIAAGFN